MRVLHIMPGFGGGISSHVRNIIRGIDSSKLVIDVVSFTDYPKDFVREVEMKGGKTYTLSNVRFKSILLNINEYKNIIRENKYDAVHMHLTDIQAVYFSVLSSLLGVKRKIVHAHIADVQKNNGFLFFINHTISRYLTVVSATDLASCSSMASEFRFGRKYVDHNKIMHIPNSIIPEKYFFKLSNEEKNKYYDELNIKEGQLVIGHVGFFGYQKNHPFIFKLAQYMKDKYDCVWIFIGTGYNFEKYVELAKSMGITEYTRFLGRRDDVNKLYKIMNVTILPSFFEGLPTVTIETQAAGTATVISDTITEETDMGLNMIERISLNSNLDIWADAIIKSANKPLPNDMERLQAIKSKNFTCETSANLYLKFLYGQISHYELN